MIFEFSIARKYLVPRKRQLSMSLIALMSIGVISLVVWLVLIFLSVTDGIEKNWLKKLTSFHAPIHVAPTQAYYQSYYYQIDTISNASNFRTKSIGEKAATVWVDPYSSEDMLLSAEWPEKIYNKDGSTKDLIKEVFNIIKQQNLIAQDYEMSGAVLQLCMTPSQDISFLQQHNQNYLTQVTYISSFCGKSPKLFSLINAPRTKDLNHLFFLANLSCNKQEETFDRKNLGTSKKFLQALLSHVTIHKMQNISDQWQSLVCVLPDNIEFDANIYEQKGSPSSIYLPLAKGKAEGKLVKHKDCLHFVRRDGNSYTLSLDTPIFLEGHLSMDVKLYTPNFHSLTSLNNLFFEMQTNLQGHKLQGTIPWDGIEILEADTRSTFETEPDIPPPWPYMVQSEAKLPHFNESSVILPKQLQNSGIKMGDRGYFSYGASTTSSIQEQRLPLYVAGFYDPGVMTIGGKCVLTSHELVRAINTSSCHATFDSNIINGIQVYVDDLSQVKDVKTKLIKAFDQAGLLPYFTITTFYEYDFAKDLFQQFQSDKYLFTLIGLIVLLVACSNIISLLIILVKDKKKEIAILRAMGATKKSIALIFTLCGGIMGVLSTFIGVLAAILTLHNIDTVVNFLSFLQGHEAFNAIFYGTSLPNTLSHHALVFIAMATPTLSLIAGCVPAIKACKLSPSQILRSE